MVEDDVVDDEDEEKVADEEESRENESEVEVEDDDGGDDAVDGEVFDGEDVGESAEDDVIELVRMGIVVDALGVVEFDERGV